MNSRLSFVARGVDYGKYRRLQILESLALGKGWLPPTMDRKLFWSKLAPLERLWAVAVAVPLLIGRILGFEALAARALLRLLGPYGFRPKQVFLDRGSFSRLIQVFEAIEKGALEMPAR